MGSMGQMMDPGTLAQCAGERLDTIWATPRFGSPS